jgi:4-diphosphocytidyl-2-C-methyl-D-erythritol kinase
LLYATKLIVESKTQYIQVVLFSNCKINLGLHIVDKRNDGFHNLETCFYPIALYDVIEIIQAPTFKFTTTGITIYSEPENNLCVKAYHILKEKYPNLPAVHIHLHKNIPTGAGIGGGSANAAFVLKGLQQKFNLPITNAELEQYAAILGSDCPFFIQNKTCLATGRGEVLEPFEIDLSNYAILLIFPQVHVSTKDAFALITPKQPAQHIADLLVQPIHTWKNNIVNDFEASVFAKHPMLAIIKEKLYQIGALYASMSGSGSTLYGIFEKSVDLKNVVDNYFDSYNYTIMPATIAS